MFGWFENLPAALAQLLEQGNPVVFAALFAIATVIEIGVPVPLVQDTVLVLVGYEPSGRLLPLAPAVIATLTAGRVFGSSIVLWISRLLGSRFMGWLDKRAPRVMSSARSIGSRMGKRTPLTVAIIRLTPGLLTPSTVAAGLLKVRYFYFCIGVVISSVIPDIAEIAYGLAIRTGFTVAGITPSPTLFIFVLAFIMVLSWLGSWLWRRRHSSRG